MDRVSVITEALQKLDHTNDEMWSEDGAPLLSVINYYAGLEDVTRKEVAKINPKLTRKWLASQFDKTADVEPVKTDAPSLDDDTAKLRELRLKAKEAKDALTAFEAELVKRKPVAEKTEHVSVSVTGYLKAQQLKREAEIEQRKKLLEQGIDVNQVAKLVMSKQQQRRGR